jgi:phosphate transport system substrate-binding protein
MRSVVKNLLMGAVVATAGFAGLKSNAASINGAGASFPAPAYQRWAFDYGRMTHVKINYQSVGSGAGIAQIKAKTVDFGASDKPLKKADLDKVGLIQFPMLMGGVVPVVNLPGVKAGQVKLSAEVLADIFLGKIKKWNDPVIVALNNGVELPDLAINVVHRSDGSGTTWIFTNYLTKVSTEWAKGPGNGKAVAWPCGIGGQKNAGVAAMVMKVKGSIGYVELAYALTNDMAYTLLKNKAGKFVAPTTEAFQAAAANADWENAPGFYMVLTDQPGSKSWPITGATYILIYKNQKDITKAANVLKFFDWAYSKGDKTAMDLHYVPMPDNVVEMVKAVWKKEVKAAGKAVYK